MNRSAALAFVRRTRRRLEGLRMLKAGARGALVLAAAAIPFVLLGSRSGWTWWLPVAGALGGLVAAWARERIAPASAALFLDAASGTEERFTTIWSNPDSPSADRWANELGGARPVPALAWPREAGLLPVALFLLFAAGLLPSGSGDDDALVVAVAEDPEPGESKPESPRGDPDAAASRLDESRPLATAERKAIERAIEAAFARPEERRRARAELTKAAGGDAAAAERLGDALVEGAGALLGEPALSRPEAAGDAENEIEARMNSPYPQEYEYLRAYTIELARLRRKEQDR